MSKLVTKYVVVIVDAWLNFTGYVELCVEEGSTGKFISSKDTDYYRKANI